MLYKYLSNPSHVFEDLEVEVRDDLTYEEQLVQIIDSGE